MIKNRYILFILLLVIVQAVKSQDVLFLGPAETKVVFQADGKIFPCKWKNKRINPEFLPLEDQEVLRTKLVLQTSLDKYPPALLKRNLKVIYVAKSIFFYGLEYGGTYFKRKIYLANNGAENGYTDAYLEGSFHHEFSSVLLKRHTRFFDNDSWQATNPLDFVYGNGGREALRMNATGLDLDSVLYTDGFLNEYSLASLEEDFNCYAEYIFRNDPGFWQAWESSEAVRRKTEILVSFYNRMDPVFTLEFFRSL